MIKNRLGYSLQHWLQKAFANLFKNSILVWMIMLLSFLTFEATSQCTNPPNGVDCLCSTATLLCTPDLLDGFTFSMSSTQNLGGYNNGTSDLCPGLPPEGVPNNVNWFSFIAWCTDLSMDVHISNCTQGTFQTFGVQIGLFAGCPPSAPVECITDGFDACGNSSTTYPTLHNFNATGLTIGNVYYFMLDGCAQSACDIMIDVIGVCGNGMIDPWTTGVTGPLETCVGNTDTYVAEDLDGAVEFYYYLDGVLIDDGTEQTSTDITWSTAGTYELCVDVSNLPCILESDPPAPYCITIVVCDEAEAGDITLTTSPACPGDVINIAVTNNTTGPDHDQYIIITDDTGEIIQVTVGTSDNFSHEYCDVLNVYSYNLKIGSPAPTLGTFFPNDYPCDDSCCDIENIQMSFEDDLAPVFDTEPANLNLSCLLELPVAVDLGYTDNCVDPGTVSPVETGAATLCEGGTLFRTWTAMDSCNNVIEYSQSIDVLPIDPPEFLTTPGDLTFDCGYTSGTIPDLAYENTQGGICFIEGVVPGTLTGTTDICGGTLEIMWTYTDTCMNVIDHTQTIVVDPAPEATWLSPPPAALTIECDAIPASAPDLFYDNGETGTCAIAGSEPATTVNNYDICGGTITNSWTYTDDCDREITFEQVITINPAPEAMFLTTLPMSMNVSCDAVPVPSGNLDISNGETGICEITETLVPVVDDQSDPCGGFISYTWEYVDDCDRPISHMQMITIDPAAAPSYINPPTDITVNCDNIPSSGSSLDFTNGLTGICELSGSTVGVLGAFDVCTGLMTETWNDTDDCGNPVTHERIITVEPIDPIDFEMPPGSMTLTCDEVPMTFPDLNFTNGAGGDCLIAGVATPVLSGSYDECGGTLVVTWTGDDGCATTINYSQTIMVTEAPMASFDSSPPDISVSCDQVPDPMPLTYSNGLAGNCMIDGEVPATESGSFNVCGGTLVYEWEFIDACGRTINESQEIIVTEAPEADWIDPPADVTLSCGDANNITTILSFTNGVSNPCLIAGNDNAIISGSFDACGGSFTQTWSYTDPCGRTIDHDRTVLVEPAADPVFIDPPEDVTLACGEAYSDPDDLVVDNGELGTCAITDIVSPTVVVDGNVYTHTWEYENECDGTTMDHVQIVTLSTAPDISIDPNFANICQAESFDLSLIQVIDANGTMINVEYYEGNPISPFNLLGSPVVTPGVSTIYTILATNEYGCTDEAIFSLILDEAPYAGEDGSVSICDNIVVNLYSLLGASYDLNGVWIDVTGSGVDLEDPTDVLFTNLDPGAYEFAYQVSSGNTCPDDEAIVTVIFNQLGEIVVDSVYCTDGNNSYTVVIQDFGYGILPNVGDIVPMNNGITEIINIPIGDVLTINFYDLQTFCASFLTVNPPDCNCPQVPLPEVVDLEICLSDLPGILTATADPTTTINWYDVASGGTALLINSNTFESPETTVGSYTYYVETESIEFPGCVSSIRVEVNLTITDSPLLNNPGLLSYCLENGETQINLNLSELSILINGNLNNEFMYFESMDDLFNQENAVEDVILTMTDSFYVEVTNVAGCSDWIGFEIVVFPEIEIDFSITNESCVNESDGSAEVMVVPASNNYVITVDGEAVGSLEINDLDPGIHIVNLYDSLTTCSASDTFEILPGVEISNDLLTFICDDNGTDTDPLDDIITLSFNFGIQNGVGADFELFIGGVSFGNFSFGVVHEIDIATSDVALEIVLIDLASGCQFVTMAGPFFPCSTNCSIIPISFSQICNDGGTPSDPSDDSYDFTINNEAVNGSGTYNVLINGTPLFTFNYNEESSFSLFADGSTPNILIVDSEDQQCSIIVEADPMPTCSDLCDLQIDEFTAVCEEDIYTISLEVTVLNGNDANSITVQIDDEAPLDFIAPEIIFEMPADEMSHWIYIYDAGEVECIDSIQIGPLDLCSTNCKIFIDPFTAECSDNETPFDSSDDYYIVSWFAISQDGSPDSTYLLYDNNVFVDFFQYSQNNSIQIDANGQPHFLEFIDNTDAVCKTNITTDTLFSCSDSCLVELEFLEISCNNNGTNNTEFDDYFEASIIVSSTNGSGSWTMDGAEYFNYNTEIIIGPFAILDGNVNLILLDSLGNCSLPLDLAAPMTCSSCEQTVEAGVDQIIDCDNQVAELIGVSSETGIYTWTGPSGIVDNDSIAIGVEEGWYYFEVEFSDGCYAIDSLFVDAIGEIPLAFAGPDSVLTCLVFELEITGTYQSNSTDLTFIWRNEMGEIVSNTPTITITETGLYSFQIVDNVSGCESAADQVFIALSIEEPEAIIYTDPGNVLNCFVELINLSTSGEANVAYQWVDDGESSYGEIYEINEPGTVVLIALDTITGCQSIDSISITQLEEYPIINLEPFDEITCETDVITLSAANSIPSTTSTFTWYDLLENELGSSSELIVIETGFYVLEMIDTITGCVNLDTIEVVDNLDLPVITNGEDLVLPCDSEEGVVSIVVESGNSSVQWTTSSGMIVGADNLESTEIFGEGQYIVQITDNLSGCIVYDTIDVTKIDDQILVDNLQAFDETCPNEQDGIINWTGIAGGVEPYEIYINEIAYGDIDAIMNLEPGIYNIEIIDANGCSFTESLEIFAGPVYQSTVPESIVISQGTSTQLNVETTIEEDQIAEIIWNPTDYLSCTDCLNPIAEPPVDITYTITIVDSNGCFIIDSIIISVRETLNIYAPNTISPNDDGVNDGFTIYSNSEVTISELAVYNRWGEQVFFKEDFPTNDSSLGWDGTFKGKSLNPAVFAFYAIVATSTGETEVIKGDVTIIK